MIEWLRDVVCQSLPLGCLASSLLAWRPFVLPYGLPFVCRNGKTMLFAGRFASALVLNPLNFERVAEPHTRRAEQGYKRRVA